MDQSAELDSRVRGHVYDVTIRRGYPPTIAEISSALRAPDLWQPSRDLSARDAGRMYTELTTMATKVPNPPPGFDELPVGEKLDYVQSLWDHIATKPEAIPVPDWHLDVIDDRLAESQAKSGTGRSWDELREELRAKLRQRKLAG